jgi:PAS domain S-box-containing protein
MNRETKRRIRLALGAILLTLLLAAVFTLGSLDVPFQPQSWRAVLALYAVSTFVVAALLVFGLILARTLLRLWAERSAERLGARFKTKMVLGAMSISLLPVIFMFYVSYTLLGRTVGRWFPKPLENAAAAASELLADLGHAESGRLLDLAASIAGQPDRTPHQGVLHSRASEEIVTSAIHAGADAAWVSASGAPFVGFEADRGASGTASPRRLTEPPRRARALRDGAEVWTVSKQGFVVARTALPGHSGELFVARRLPFGFLERYAEMERQTLAYGQETQLLRALKNQMVLILLLFTLLLLFAVTWLALFLSKQVTVPIQALAEGTREVSAGNFDYQVQEQAQDELGVLVRSFNQMTTQLRDSRRQIDEFTQNLQQAVQELERRRKLMETILENIPTGVLSLDAEGSILRANPAVARIFGEAARMARTLDDLMGLEAARPVQGLMRRSLRMGVVSREIEVGLGGRLLHAAVTVSSLGPRQANAGYVVVVDDLTELLRAQKSAAWQEVAQRIAHEIKNPLTPIQLSAQRLLRSAGPSDNPVPSGAAADREERELKRMVHECASLIEREVAALAALVDEFSQFVRFPSAKLSPSDANTVVQEALDIFSGRLDGITTRVQLGTDLPMIRADMELLRRVLVNLIDNAAEALESSRVKEIQITTRFRPESETVEITVADTGQGISAQDKDKLFLPHFSTKDRGTGLGLAIAARIMAEHGGSIRVQDNVPAGSCFLLEVPIAEASVSSYQAQA